MSAAKDDGGPAFPVPYSNERDGPTVMPTEGMTLRDYFAAHALQGLLANPKLQPQILKTGGAHGGWIEASSLAFADAMLKERAK